MRYSKSVMKQAAEVPEAEGWEINAEAVGVVFSSADAMEGPIAFAEKRAPTGRASRPGRARRRRLDTVRLTLHVLAATVWVGGQIVMTGLVGPARGLGADAPKTLARAFARLAWPAYVVLLATGVWNVTAVHYSSRTRPGRPCSWPRSPWSSWPAWASSCTSGPPPQGPAGPLGLGRRPGQRGRAGHGHPAGRADSEYPHGGAAVCGTAGREWV